MKTLTVYYLENEINEDILSKMKERFKCECVISFRACNQLNGIQYPYFVTKQYEL